MYKDDIDLIGLRARKVLGFDNDIVIDYNAAVEHYIKLINYYSTNLELEKFKNIEIFETLNYSFNYCTGFVIEDYIDDYLDDRQVIDAIVKVRSSENIHYHNLLVAASLAVDRYMENNMTDVASMLGASFYVIANAIYDYEKSLDNIDIKSLS